MIKPKQAFKVDPELRWIVSLQGDHEPDKKDSCEHTLRKTLSSSQGALRRISQQHLTLQPPEASLSCYEKTDLLQDWHPDLDQKMPAVSLPT